MCIYLTLYYLTKYHLKFQYLFMQLTILLTNISCGADVSIFCSNIVYGINNTISFFLQGVHLKKFKEFSKFKFIILDSFLYNYWRIILKTFLYRYKRVSNIRSWMNVMMSIIKLCSIYYSHYIPKYYLI